MYRALLLTSILSLASFTARSEEVSWQDLSSDAFRQAAAEHKLVLLDVSARWCHWCHVMDRQTYANADVQSLLRAHYVTTRVDADENPDISRRYEDYGWPATIIFAPDGTEIAKRRGYIEPGIMKTVLKETFANPKARLHQAADYAAAETTGLSDAERTQVISSIVFQYDQKNGGWGDSNRYLDADMMELAITQGLGGNRVFGIMALQTLPASFNLIDPAWGGVYQYSDSLDWKSPHYEKILSIQSAYIFSYAYAYGATGKAQYRDAARKITWYLDRVMRTPQGAFYTSQDADISRTVTGHDYYMLNDEGRRKLGLPKTDTHIYTSENGALISALATLYAMTGDRASLGEALHAMRWLIYHRTLAKGFAHGEADKDGPFLADSLAAARAMLDLYAVTGDRSWLKGARIAAQYIVSTFADEKDGGFFTTPAAAHGALKPYRNMDENIAAARFFNLLAGYTREQKFKQEATGAFRSLASRRQVAKNSFSPGLLLADDELKHAPLHLTVVGRKNDPAAATLFAAAIATVPLYKQTEWLDKREGDLPGSDLAFPDLPQPAVFICTGNTCSLPLSDAKALKTAVEKIRQAE